MSRTVFILGAGASAGAGAPVMSNFLDVAEELRRSDQLGDDAAAFDLVFKAISKLQLAYAKATIDINNLEHLFSAFEMARLIRRLPGLTDDELDGLREAMESVIVRTLEESISYPVVKGDVLPPEAYREFADKVVQLYGDDPDSVSILTFNYDIALDVALRFSGAKLNYGLSGNKDTDGLPLLKLHGSLHWYRVDEHTIASIDISQKYAYSALEERDIIGDWDAAHARLRARQLNPPASRAVRRPVIVPPNWDKLGEQRELKSVWQAAARHLSESESILVAGYSLPQTDQFFRYLFALGTISEIRPKRFWVFDISESEQLDARFKGLIGQLTKDRYGRGIMSFKDFARYLDPDFETLQAMLS